MFAKLAIIAAVATAALGNPLPREPSPPTDTDILQFALTLEHLENAFYSSALTKYSAGDFEAAGFESWVRGRFTQIAAHEAAHVKFLQTALGPDATKPCTYSFPHTDPRSFAALSMVLETVGGSAYLGAAQFIEDKDILTDAASILAVESRHSGWVSSAVLKQQPWNGPLDTPLLPSGAFSLAAQFITSCPQDNPALPVQAHPALTISNAAPAAGEQVTFTYNRSPARAVARDDADTDRRPRGKFVVWLDGLDVIYTALSRDGKTIVPQGLAGTVYAAVVSTKSAPVSDATLVTGFAVVQFPFNSKV